MNINKAIKEEYRNKTFKELLKAPVSAIQNISEYDAELLYKVFKIKTIDDFARLQSVKWARSIMTLAEMEE